MLSTTPTEPRPEDVQMVAHCLEGDGAAWETLVAKHRRRVFNIAYKFTGRHDRAEDLSQEIFLRVFKNLGKFDPSADFSKWLASVARNHCIDNYRSTRREQRTMVDDGMAFDLAVAPLSTNPLRSIEASEAKEFLRSGLAMLPEKLREAVVLRDLKGLAYEEMAVKLSLPVGTIKSRINRGREELARALRAKGPR
ncbi:MAG TPA: RNA polymerase sigma factor [Vicinamibacteria bacterium]|nr:RNA polymerase sigma factor [Vicinamibacteria bacterium]HRB12015.1 RNA polymerase sigma factor [Vicinamibacteria bacterium]